ncbi:MAG: chorismate synthase [Duncaniella sp.]|nr:chorismate synthase [Duncaniella sp.]
MDSTGTILTLTTFGESHGPALGGVLTGLPAGAAVDMNMLQDYVNRRSPADRYATSRREPDRVEILSGIFEGQTLGTPVGYIIRNTDTRSADYTQWADAYRPNHADFTYEAKYGLRDWRGGGRASARETAARVVAGALAVQLLQHAGVTVNAYTSGIGSASLKPDYSLYDIAEAWKYPLCCPDADAAADMQRQLENARSQGDSLGGTVTCVIRGMKAGVGEPVFGKLQSRLAAAMLSIPAAKGFDYGLGFVAASARGSEVIDRFRQDFTTETNFSGGIQGGITNGADIYFRVAFKPVATLMRPMETVDRSGNKVTLPPRGRHDVCVVPRAVVVVEAMAALTVLDAMLLNRSSRL